MSVSSMRLDKLRKQFPSECVADIIQLSRRTNSKWRLV